MKIVADEGVDAPVVHKLRKEGHSVTFIAELHPGITDDQVLQMADLEGRFLLTVDKDFGELVYRLKRVHHGVVLIRLEGLALQSKAEMVSQAI